MSSPGFEARPSGQARRRAGGRTPGAHRASSPDGLIPGFRRQKARDDRSTPDPFPSDPRVSGDPGFTDGSWAEGGLTEAEMARADLAGGPAAGKADVASPSLVRSSGVMALGTLASRVTGMLRTLVLVAAIGTVALGNAYTFANTLPNTVYNLAIGGILTSVIVPLLVNASRRDRDGGERYDQRMFTLVTFTLGAITLAATLAAAPIALLYDRAATGSERQLVVIFAYFFIPQIFFYGVSSLAGAILNARGHFAAPMWTPVVNNVVVILVAAAFMVIYGVHQTADTIPSLAILLLGIGTTLGIVAQTVALVPALRKVGFRWRPRFDFRRYEVTEIGRMSGWMFGYVLTTQVAFLVTSMVASTAGRWATAHDYDVGIGFSAYNNAWMLFQLPYAVVAISVITALLPRMSANAADRRYDLVRADFSTGVRLGSVIVAPAALVLTVLGPSLAVVLLAWGNNSIASARYQGLVFSIFSLGLMPYMIFQLQLRVFYSLHDSKTPALIGVITMIANVAANLIALAVFPATQVVAALGAGFGIANLVGCVLCWRVLSKRLGGLAGRQIGTGLARMHVAALPGALFALAVTVLISGVFSASKLTAAAIVLFGGAGALLFYLMFAKMLKVNEVTDLTGMVRARLRR